MPAHGRGPSAATRTTRSAGREFRALAWLVRHPLFVLIPALLIAGVVRWGVVLVGLTLGGLVLVMVAWWRAHPATFDRYAAPRLRTARRRWTDYRGGRWRAVLDDCDLSKEHRRTGGVAYPRLQRVRSASPSIDLLRVRTVPGQDLRLWTDRLPALTEALCAERIAISRYRPGVLALVVERRMPFTELIDATPMPEHSEDVDLTAVPLGEDEYGNPFTIRVRGKHYLGVGGTGAGKSGLMWNPLRGITPLIRDGYARIWMVDLKGGTETELGEPVFHRWATTMPDALALLTEFRDSMKTRQTWMKAKKLRACPITPTEPLEILVVDELAMLTAYGDRSTVRDALRLLAEVMTQGRAADHTVWAFVQEPSKDVVDVRDLFNLRLCLGVNAASHVDMALGDGARDRGALADEIPGDPQHAGIGFAINTGTRMPVRFRAGLVEDHEITDWARYCAPGPFTVPGQIVPFPHTTDQDDTDGEESAS
jgi:DNA segregation ATPase FtsK/SpoIIIE, S-DNA-T family